jgi:hypothetical protein
MIELHVVSPNPSTRRDTIYSHVRWSPPPEGTVLINVDAALFNPSRRMGIGVVIRDHNGVCLTACSELREEVTALELAEVLALSHVVSLAADEGFDKVMVVSDYLSLVQQRWQSPDLDRSIVGVVIQDIKQLQTGFSSFAITHVRRQYNVLAHILARSAELFRSTVFRNFTPECI